MGRSLCCIEVIFDLARIVDAPVGVVDEAIERAAARRLLYSAISIVSCVPGSLAPGYLQSRCLAQQMLRSCRMHEAEESATRLLCSLLGNASPLTKKCSESIFCFCVLLKLSFRHGPPCCFICLGNCHGRRCKLSNNVLYFDDFFMALLNLRQYQFAIP